MFFGPRGNIGNLKYPNVHELLILAQKKKGAEQLKYLRQASLRRGPGETLLYSLTITVIVVTALKDDARKQVSLLKITQILSSGHFSDYVRAYYGGGEEDLHACIFSA